MCEPFGPARCAARASLNAPRRPGDGRLDRLYSPPEIGAPGRRRAHADQRDLLLAGLFVSAMAAVVVIAFMLVLPGLFGQTYRLHAYFPRADGLDAGIQVVQEGFVIGLVERVEPVFPGDPAHQESCLGLVGSGADRSPSLPCFRATLRIRDRWPIPLESQAQLTSLGLLQGDAIEIHPGRERTLFADGGVIEVRAADADLTAQLSALIETVRTVVEEMIAPTLASIRDQVKTIETLIGSGTDQDENRDRLAGAFENLRQLSENLVKAVDAEAIGEILASVQMMSASLAEITSELAGGTDDVRRAVTDYGELAVDIRGVINENRPALQSSLQETQFLMQSIAAALIPILTNIEDATRDLSTLARELRSDPRLLFKRREQEEQAPWFR